MLLTVRWLLVALLACLLTIPVAASTNQQGWQAFEIRDGFIALPAKVNQVEGWALFDTGATGISVNQALFKQSDMQFTEQLVEGGLSTRVAAIVSNVEVEFLGSEVTLQSAKAFPLGGFLMVLGRDVFGRSLLQIDYPNQRMRILKRGAIPESKFGNIAARRSRFGIMVQVSLPGTGESFWLALDTGNNSAIMTSRRAAERYKLLNKPPYGSGTIKDINGAMATMEHHVIPELKIGPFTVEEVAMYVEAAGSAPILGKRSGRIFGLAGYDLFKHFLLTISFDEAQVHLTVPSSH